MRARFPAPILALLLALGACGDRGDFWEEPLAIDGPIVAGGSIVFLQRNLGLLTWLKPAGDETPRTLAMGGRARALAGTGDRALVLAGTAQAPHLDVVTLPDGERDRIALDAPWDRAAATVDAGRALLFFAADAPIEPGAAPVRNPNLVGVVDLDAGRVETLHLASKSAGPRGVVFDEAGAFAAVLFEDAVAIVDLEDPARHRTLPLQLRDGTLLRPREAIFSPSGRFLFVRADGTDDVVTVERIDADGEFDLAVNFLFAAGLRGLRDIAVSPPLGEAVVALYADGAALLDATGDVSATRIVDPLPSLQGILDTGDGLLLFHPDIGGDLLAGWEPLTGRLVLERLDRPLIAPPVAAGGVAILPQRNAVTVASLAPDPARLRIEREALQLTGTPRAVAIDDARRFAWLGLESEDPEVEEGALAGISLDDGAGVGLTLDAPVADVGVAGDHVYVVHPGLLGDLTIVPQDDPRRGAAARYGGVAASGMLDREER